MKRKASVARTKTIRNVYPPMTVRNKDGTEKTVRMVVTTPAKPELSYVMVNFTFESIRDAIEQIQSQMAATLKRDIKTIDEFKEQRSLHSLDFYYWALSSYATTQASVLNLLAYVHGLTLLCGELEKRDGAPVNVQVEVPKQVEKEMQAWFSEREAAKRAQKEYIK